TGSIEMSSSPMKKTIPSQGVATMNKKMIVLDLLIGAVLKLDHRNGERQNVLSFVRSCYGGRVTNYDLDIALASLTRLTDEEQNALIAWVVWTDNMATPHKAPVRA